MQLSHLYKDLFYAIWVFLPAGLGNVTPILVAKISWRPLQKWQTPIDFGRTFRGKRIFGTHKTWRGLVTGMIISTLVLAGQQTVVRHDPTLASWILGLDYTHLPTLILGPLFGLGALGGDAIKSFFKRQRGVAPGESWYPFDQIDLPIGALIATWAFLRPSFTQTLLVLCMWWLSQLVWSYIGYLLHFKDKPI